MKKKHLEKKTKTQKTGNRRKFSQSKKGIYENS